MSGAAVLTAETARASHPGARASAVNRTTPLCGYSHIEEVTAADLTGDRVGALEGNEHGWIGHCKCGWSSPVRYSPISAQSGVCAHVFRALP